MKAHLSGLNAIHDMGDFRNSYSESPERIKEGFAKMGVSIKPLIDSHPVNGRKFLNFNEAFATHIDGMTTTDANALKTMLAAHMNKPDDQMRWRWKAGDLAMWDNRVTQHYAVADYLPAYRCMNRVTVVRDGRA